MISSSLPPIKGLSAFQSLSHHRIEINLFGLPSVTEIDYGSDANNNDFTFSCDDLLCAFIGMFIKTPSTSLSATAAIFSIGERTLKRYQSQIAANLGLSQNSSRLPKTYLKATPEDIIKNKSDACRFIDNYLLYTVDAVAIIIAQDRLL